MSKFSDKLRETYDEYKRCGKVENKTQFAKCLGVSPQTLFNWLYCTSVPCDDIKQEIADKIGVKYENLYNESTFYKKVSLILNILDMPKKQLARDLGLHEDYIIRTRYGKWVTDELVDKVSEYLGVSKEWLLEEDNFDYIKFMKKFILLSQGDKEYICAITKSLCNDSKGKMNNE